MKFLVKHFFLLFIFSNFLLSVECYEQWYEENIDENKKAYILKGFINNNDDIKIYINYKNNYRIDFLDKIIIGDSFKTFNFSKTTKQLYIDKNDETLSEFMFSFFNLDSLTNKIKINKNNYLKLRKSSYGNVEVFLDTNCTVIDSIVINRMKKQLIIKDILIAPILETVNIDSLFILDFKDEEIFKYDLR